jgi:death on curing protein
MIEPEFLTLEDVLLIHDEQLEAYGGIQGIRDKGLLESAVMTAQASFGGEYLHSGLFEMTAAYAFTLLKISRSWMATNARHLFRLWFFSTLTAL